MPPTFTEEDPLPYPTLTHRTCWPGNPLSEEYLIPLEDKQRILDQLYPLVEPPNLSDVLLDIHEEKEFVVRDYKVVREGGMNMLVSPYYYRSGGSVIDWMPVEHPPQDAEEVSFGLFSGTTTAQPIKPGGTARLTGLIERQHEGPGL